jgi:hypothetical protein
MCHPCRSTLTRPLAPAARPPFRPHHHINGEAPKRNLLDSAQQAPRTMSRSHFHLTSCGVNLFIVVAPCGPILQKRGGGRGHACQDSSWPNSHSDITANSISKLQQRWEASTPCRPRRCRPGVIDLHRIQTFFSYIEPDAVTRICYHVIDK